MTIYTAIWMITAIKIIVILGNRYLEITEGNQSTHTN